jgi:hypothetical protein
MPVATAEGIKVIRNVMPNIPVNDAIWITGRRFACEYAMLAAVPSGEKWIIKNSNVVKNTGKAKTESHELVLIITFRVRRMIKAKMKGSNMVKIMAGTRVATITK